MRYFLGRMEFAQDFLFLSKQTKHLRNSGWGSFRNNFNFVSLFIYIFHKGYMYLRRKIEWWWCTLRTSLNLSIKYSQQTYILLIFLSINLFFLHWWFWLWAKEFLYRPKRIMDALKAAIIRYKLPLKFDNPTEGQGNCFPNVQ